MPVQDASLTEGRFGLFRPQVPVTAGGRHRELDRQGGRALSPPTPSPALDTGEELMRQDRGAAGADEYPGHKARRLGPKPLSLSKDRK